MTHLIVDSERIHAANSAIQGTISRLQTEVTTLHSQLAGLNDSWQGVAASCFQDLLVRWRTASDAVESSLGQIGQALSIAAQQYSDIEFANQGGLL
jgi:early secretory antigenic target protein ESAT-6